MRIVSPEPAFDFSDPALSPFRFDETVPADPEVPYILNRSICGWPYGPERDIDYFQHGCGWERLSDVLTFAWKTDVYFLSYLFQHLLLCTPRLVGEALEGADGKPIFGDGIRVGLFAVDRDCPAAHKSGGGKRKSADEAWRAVERKKVELLRQKIPGVFFYETRGLLVIDESPPLFRHTEFTPKSVALLKKALDTWLYEPKFISACRPAVRLLEAIFAERQKVPNVPFEASKAAAAQRMNDDLDWRLATSNAVRDMPAPTGAEECVVTAARALERGLEGQHVPPLEEEPLRQIRSGDAKKADLISTSWELLYALLAALRGGDTVRAEWDAPPPWAPSETKLRVTVFEPTVSSALSRPGPTVVLDATADEQAIVSVTRGKVRRVVKIEVSDGASIERVLRYWAKGSRTATHERSRPNSEVIAPVLKDALTRARASNAAVVLVVSYKSVSEYLRAVVPVHG